jgi:hypothetical protein
MNGLEALAGLERMTIHQCQRLTIKLDAPDATFDLCGPKGKKPCKWLDVDMGLFQIDGQDGFCMVSDFEFMPNIWCENLLPKSAAV